PLPLAGQGPPLLYRLRHFLRSSPRPGAAMAPGRVVSLCLVLVRSPTSGPAAPAPRGTSPAGGPPPSPALRCGGGGTAAPPRGGTGPPGLAPAFWPRTPCPPGGGGRYRPCGHESGGSGRSPG